MSWWSNFWSKILVRGGVGEFIPKQSRLQKIIAKIKKILVKGEK